MPLVSWQKRLTRLLVMGTHGVVGVQRIVGAFAVKGDHHISVRLIIVQRKHDHQTVASKPLFAQLMIARRPMKIIHIISMAEPSAQMFTSSPVMKTMSS